MLSVSTPPPHAPSPTAPAPSLPPSPHPLPSTFNCPPPSPTQVRSLGLLAVLVSFVGAGTYRGMKDTRTPLLAALCAMVTKLTLNVAFLYGAQCPVYGCLKCLAL